MNIKEVVKSLSKGNFVKLPNWSKDTYLRIEYCRCNRSILPYIFKYDENGKGIPWVVDELELASNDYMEISNNGKCDINERLILLELKKAFIASYVPPGMVLVDGTEIEKKFNSILDACHYKVVN